MTNFLHISAALYYKPQVSHSIPRTTLKLGTHFSLKLIILNELYHKILMLRGNVSQTMPVTTINTQK